MEREIGSVAFMMSVMGWCMYKLSHQVKSIDDHQKEEEMSGYESLIGNTPLIRLNSLSTLTGCEIYVKVEFTLFISNPQLYLLLRWKG
jgi:hypothetical protein